MPDKHNWRGQIGRLLYPGVNAQITTLAVLIGAVGVAPGILAAGSLPALSLTAFAGAAAVVLRVSLLAAWRLRVMTTQPLQRLLGFSNRMAAGDLTKSMDSQHSGMLDRMERALNQLNVNIRSIVSDARTKVDRMGSATSNIAVGSHDLSTRSGQAVQAVTQTMQAINESSHRIGEIIQVIEGIAFQTNILALNAAAEAARAGEQSGGTLGRCRQGNQAADSGFGQQAGTAVPWRGRCNARDPPEPQRRRGHAGRRSAAP